MSMAYSTSARIDSCFFNIIVKMEVPSMKDIVFLHNLQQREVSARQKQCNRAIGGTLTIWRTLMYMTRKDSYRLKLETDVYKNHSL